MHMAEDAVKIDEAVSRGLDPNHKTLLLQPLRLAEMAPSQSVQAAYAHDLHRTFHIT